MSGEEKPEAASGDSPLPPAVEDSEDSGELDLDARVLCSDGACIGVIGPDGLCRECGKPLDPADVASAEAGRSDQASSDGGDQDLEEEEPPEDEDDTTGGDVQLDGRVLCSDGSCIGVIGPDGRCRECGKPLEGPPD